MSTTHTSLVGMQAAVMRRNGVARGTWIATDLVTIDHETEANVCANHAMYGKPDFKMRETPSPRASFSSFIRLSFKPDDLAAAKDYVQVRNEENARRQHDRQQREDWLRQLKPALAKQIVNRIQTLDSDPMIKALADGLTEDELRKVCMALNLQT